jgi:hypothetical protein
MRPRTDIITASRVDLALILLPVVTRLEVSYMLAVSGVPEEVAVRVLALPLERRAPTSQIGQVDELAPPAAR